MSGGKYFEELTVGAIYKHRPGRTVTETDNLLFTTLTHNTQSLHLDEEYSKSTIYGGRIVNSLFTLSFVVGVSVGDLTEGTTLGNLGFEETTFPAPVRIGDTLQAETEIVGKRESKSRPETGIVWFEHRGYNQRGELVVKTKRTGLMLKKPVKSIIG
jgi:acyl dehydratase